MRHQVWVLGVIVALALAPASAASAQPLMKLEQPADGAVLAQPVQFSGYALRAEAKAGTGVDAVEIWAYSLDDRDIRMTFVAHAKYGVFREDVAKELGWQFAESGFEIGVSGLKSGGYTFVVRARSDETGLFDQSQQVNVWITGGPEMAIDGPADQSSVNPSFTIWGWAIDASALKDTGVEAVEIWAFSTSTRHDEPVFLGAATYGLLRDDVAAAFGKRFANSGYELEVSSKLLGTFEIVAFARSSVTGLVEQMKSVTVHIGDKNDKLPIGRIRR
jgi:hypothetical protein